MRVGALFDNAQFFIWFLCSSRISVLSDLNFSSILANISSLNSFILLIAATINIHNNIIKT